MEKILLKETYGYKNFIDSETQNFLVNWTNSNISIFRNNPMGYGRKNKTITNEDSIYEIVQNIKRKIIEVENLDSTIVDFSHRDYIGVNLEGAFIHTHLDYNDGDLIHTRWNLILSYPIDGGHSIYNGEINILEEKLIWKCVAGKYSHGSTKVIGIKPRITLSLGFLIKEN
jgi:hypothetical protein